ncbi:hypothetical protein L208DRAFT_1260825, partial [Tricholoma matsutake]
ATPVTKQCPNLEPRPGVFSFKVNVISGEARCEFSAETDGSWEDFQICVVGYLETATGVVKLGYKVSGDTGKPTLLETIHDYQQAMDHIVQ